jgi:hypothetical protein
MNESNMKEPTKAELVDTVNELSGLVSDMRKLLDDMCETYDYDGWLARHMKLLGIPNRMEALGFRGEEE